LFNIATNAEGSVWVCIGTDSGFEGTTTLYYNKIELTFDNMTGVGDAAMRDDAILFPNPVKDILIINNRSSEIQSIELFNSNGQMATSVRNSDRVSVKSLKPGTYSVRVTYADHSSVTRKIIIQ